MDLTQIHNSNVASGGVVPIGTILPFASDIEPSGWMVCDGRELSRTNYPELYAVIGEAWGSSGVDVFNIPDLRGRFLRGHDDGAGRDPDAASRGSDKTGAASGDNVGSVQGDATSKNGLTATSTGNVDTGGAHSHNISAAYAGSLGPPYNLADGSSAALTGTYGTSLHTGHTHGLSLSTTINSNDNETRPINASVTYIIKY